MEIDPRADDDVQSVLGVTGVSQSLMVSHSRRWFPIRARWEPDRVRQSAHPERGAEEHDVPFSRVETGERGAGEA